MEQKVRVILKSQEVPAEGATSMPICVPMSQDDGFIRRNLSIGGKAAGICYAPDDYLSNGIQDYDQSLKRTNFNIKSGHTSVFEHSHITFIIETSKMMCIILNSCRLYSTSEKSSRYTMLNPESELENSLYDKWLNKFTDLMKVYGINRTDAEIKKLAMENAAYMLSVFVPTYMEYTVPFSRALMTIQWLLDLSKHCKEMKMDTISLKDYCNFWKKIGEESEDLANKIAEAINLDNIHDTKIKDHKGVDPIKQFLNYDGTQRLCNIETDLHSRYNGPRKDSQILELVDVNLKRDQYGDNYTYNYKCSLAALAQLVRHRTTVLSLHNLHFGLQTSHTVEYKNNPIYGEKNNYPRIDFYIPKLIRGTMLEKEWIEDLHNLTFEGILPRAFMINVCEQSRIEDFILKCKERLCMRAQLETCDIVRKQLLDFYNNRNDKVIVPTNTNNTCCTHINDSFTSKEVIRYSYKNFAEILKLLSLQCGELHDVPRCKMSGYTCKEPCKYVSEYQNRII